MAKEILIGIYKITNSVDGKIYVGQSKNIYRRWKEHKTELNNKRKNNRHLQYAWNKYKEENFIFCIIEQCTMDELDSKEDYWINHYNSTNENCGYNVVTGGNLSKIIPEEMKERLRLLQKNHRPIYQISLLGIIEKEWFGAREASKKLGILQPSLLNCLKHRRKTSKGFIWIYKDEYDKNTFDIKDYDSLCPILKVVQMNLNCEKIKTWDSALAITKLLGLDDVSISKCCKGNIPLSLGYVWMYEKDINEKSILLRKIEVDKVRKRYICLIDKDGNIIKKYKKSKECSIELEIDQSQIVKVCAGTRKTAKGYMFKYGEYVI